MKARSITVITSGLGVGGSELQVVQLAVGLHRLGWHVDVVSMQPGGPYAKPLTEEAIGVVEIEVGKFASPASLLLLRASIASMRPDLIHTQAFRANLWGRLIGITLGIPVVASVRATYSYIPRLYYPFERWLASHSAAVVTPSRATSRYLVERVGVAKSRLVTIPNGVDTLLFSPRTRVSSEQRHRNDENRFVILAPGRLVAYKNHAAVIDAFRQLIKTRPEALLVVAGTGPLEMELRRRAGGLESVVRFVGELNREAMANAMATSDVVCSASRLEGMPNVILEAMAMGLPVVAAAVDGIPEVITDHENGLLVQPDNLIGLVAALEELAGSKMLRARLGERARADVLNENSINLNVARHVDLYERLLGIAPQLDDRTKAG